MLGVEETVGAKIDRPILHPGLVIGYLSDNRSRPLLAFGQFERVFTVYPNLTHECVIIYQP